MNPWVAIPDAPPLLTRSGNTLVTLENPKDLGGAPRAVAGLVALDSASYRICTSREDGFCRAEEEHGAMILSEIQDLEQNGSG